MGTVSRRYQGNHARRYRLTFRAWLYQHHEDLSSEVGAVARTLLTDRCLDWHAVRCLSSYHAHRWLSHDDHPADLMALRRTWQAYQREVCARVEKRHAKDGMTLAQIDLIRQQRAAGWLLREIAEHHHISIAQAQRIATGQAWQQRTA